MNLGRIFTIIKKDFDIELRQKYAVGGIFLFAITTTYLIYKTFNKVSALEWNILAWIIVLFAGLNAIVKSFLQEKKETYLYYYTMFSAFEVIISKLIYNFFFTLFLAVVVLGTFTVLLGNPIKDFPLFIKVFLLGILGISSVFTFVSSVSSTGNNNATLMSILALPLVLPVVLIMERVTAIAMRLINDTDVDTDLLMLGGIDLLIVGMAILIFPILWKS